MLVSLIHHGVVPSFPKATSSVVSRQLKATCTEYHELVTAYSSQNIHRLRTLSESHRGVYEADGNWGLVKQCVRSLFKRSILRLTQTYLTLSLKDIAETIKLSSADEAEGYILRMIEAGEINATIDQRAGMVNFQEDFSALHGSAMGHQLEERIAKVMALSSKLQSVSDTMSCDKAYLSKMTHKERHGRWQDYEAAGEAAVALPTGI